MRSSRAATSRATFKLLEQKDDFFLTLDARYAGHARYPHIERDAAFPDTLTAILSPQSAATP